MALILKKPKYQITVDAAKVYVTDITGAYDAVSNPGGWGSPNPELDESAVVAFVQRIVDNVGTTLDYVDNYAVYDPTAENTKETRMEFDNALDGHIKIVIFRLPVSLDGATKVGGGSLVEGEFFYWNEDESLVWKREAGLPIPVDLAELEGEGSVVQSTCEDLIFPRLAIAYNTLYSEYMEDRDGSCNNADALFNELLHFRMDLAGAKYRFKNGYHGSAEDIIDSLLKKYEVTV